MPAEIITKICSVCKINKSVSYFYRDRDKKDGYASTCKICSSSRVKKWNQSEKGRLHKKIYRESKNGREANLRGGRKYRTTEKWKLKKESIEYLRNRRIWDKARYIRNPDKHRARKRIYNRVKFDKIPRPENLPCKKCGDVAREYHHYLGYEKIHWNDVMPLCLKCHIDIHHSRET